MRKERKILRFVPQKFCEWKPYSENNCWVKRKDVFKILTYVTSTWILVLVANRLSEKVWLGVCVKTLARDNPW